MAFPNGLARTMNMAGHTYRQKHVHMWHNILGLVDDEHDDAD